MIFYAQTNLRDPNRKGLGTDPHTTHISQKWCDPQTEKHLLGPKAPNMQWSDWGYDSSKRVNSRKCHAPGIWIHIFELQVENFLNFQRLEETLISLI